MSSSATSAVLAVERGEPKIVVVAPFGVSRQTLHTWLTRYAQLSLLSSHWIQPVDI
ncbi:MAG: hypothetical protein M3Y48_21770 [Actinomycetota bacterium]|nr:hypothetical protein [Actinomycetota bacterium]